MIRHAAVLIAFAVEGGIMGDVMVEVVNGRRYESPLPLPPPEVAAAAAVEIDGVELVVAERGRCRTSRLSRPSIKTGEMYPERVRGAVEGVVI